MLTHTEEKHTLPIDDRAGVIKLLEHALNKASFNSFNVYISQEWPAGSFTGKPTKLFTMTVGHKYDTNK